MTTITEICTTREAQADRLADAVNELELAFKELQASTMQLHQATFHLGNKMAPAIHGLDNLDSRVKALILWKLYGTAGGETIDLPAITAVEHKSALNLEAQNANS